MQFYFDENVVLTSDDNSSKRMKRVRRREGSICITYDDAVWIEVNLCHMITHWSNNQNEWIQHNRKLEMKLWLNSKFSQGSMARKYSFCGKCANLRCMRFKFDNNTKQNHTAEIHPLFPCKPQSTFILYNEFPLAISFPPSSRPFRPHVCISMWNFLINAKQYRMALNWIQMKSFTNSVFRNNFDENFNRRKVCQQFWYSWVNYGNSSFPKFVFRKKCFKFSKLMRIANLGR